MPSKALVVDANILVRAVLGRRVREVIETYAGKVSFFVPEVAYDDAEEHLPELVVKRGGGPGKALTFLRSLRGLVDSPGFRQVWWKPWEPGAERWQPGSSPCPIAVQ